MFVGQRLQSDLQFLLFFGFFDFLFPFFQNQGIRQAPLNAQGLFFAFAHIAFQRQAGIGFLKILARWAGSPAEGALVVFLAVNGVFISTGTFGGGIVTRVYRNIYVLKRFADHANTALAGLLLLYFGAA
jgi:hypothetical protein